MTARNTKTTVVKYAILVPSRSAMSKGKSLFLDAERMSISVYVYVLFLDNVLVLIYIEREREHHNTPYKLII
jgi:hypothetical protein